jgi:apolipoprotein N-acyltransferase
VIFYSFLLSLLSGVLLFLSFPKFNSGFLIWVALAPLLIALKGKNLRVSFALGLATGLTFFLGLLYWINIFSTAGLIILCLCSGFYVAIFCLGLNFIRMRSGVSEIILAPFLWTALEYLRSLGLLGFPWGSLAYAQYGNLPLIQVASFTSVYGVSFLIVLVNAVLAKGRLRNFLFLAVIFIPLLLYGRKTLSQALPGESLKVGLIQGGIPQEKKWEAEFLDTTIKLYHQKTLGLALAEEPLLIIWPETTIPGYLEENEELRTKVARIARESQVYLIAGSPSFDLAGRYYNSAFLISPQGEIEEEYRKIHLVPFGEFIPFKRFLPFIEKAVVGVSDFSPGGEYTVFNLPRAKFSVIICFEDIFPSLVRNFVREGAQFMVNITNDAWYKRTSAPYQHATMAVFRAVENRVSLVRAANTGVSSFIDPYGRIERNTEIFVSEALARKVLLPRHQTFYTRYGDIFSYFCLGLSTIFLLGSLVQRP